MTKKYALQLTYLDAIMGILGTTKANLWPFLEETGTLVTGIAATDLTSAETGGAAEALEDDFAPILHPGGIYSYHFHPTGDHHLAGLDHANYSFGDGLDDSAFSVGGLIIPSTVNDNTILSKYDSAGGAEEYRFFIDSNGLLSLELHDANVSTKEVGVSDTALGVGRAHFVVYTYDGGQTGPVAYPYVDGERDGNGATTETGAYVAMEATATPLLIGAGGVTATPTTEFHGRLGLPFLTGKELSAAEVKALWNIYREMFGL